MSKDQILKNNDHHAPSPSVEFRQGRPDTLKVSPEWVRLSAECSHCYGTVPASFMPRKGLISTLIDMKAQHRPSVVTANNAIRSTTSEYDSSLVDDKSLLYNIGLPRIKLGLHVLDQYTCNVDYQPNGNVSWTFNVLDQNDSAQDYGLPRVETVFHERWNIDVRRPPQTKTTDGRPYSV